MSTSAVGSSFQTLAAHLSSVNLPGNQEQRLFQQAVKDVCDKSQDVAARNVAAQLRQTQSPDDIIQLFNDWRDSNKLWKRLSADTWSRRLARVSDTVLKFKAVGEGLAQINQSIGGPIWGLLYTSLAVFKGLGDTDENLDLIERDLETFLRHISDVFIPGYALPKNLEHAISHLYRVVVEFSVHVAVLFQETMLGSWKSAATRKLHDELDRFSKNLYSASKSIEMGMSTELRRDVKAIQNAQAFPVSNILPVNTNTVIRHFPSMLSTSFVGRQRELALLQTNILSTPQHGVPLRSAIIGIGGAGKTQIILQGIDRHIIQVPALGNHSVIFIRAESQSSILAGFGIVGEKLKLANSMLSETQPTKLIERIKTWLEVSPGWLLIFDNVADYNDIQNFIPNTGNGHILLTSRSSVVASAWTGPENIISVEPLDEITGKELVFKLVPNNIFPGSILEERAACEIVTLSGGLPLAIEQIVKNAGRLGISWDEAISICRQRRTFLQQQNFSSNHELNLSVGAILQTSLETLEKDYPEAVALYRLLVCFDVSSIPLQFLYGAKTELQAYFERPTTYTKGTTGSSVQTPVPVVEPTKRSGIDYFRRLKIARKKPATQSTTLRVDSKSDTELHAFWISQKTCLQEVLSDQIHIRSAINVLVDAGLVKRTSALTVWIHDLFAQLTQALVETCSGENYRRNVHLASTMVYLTLPTPDGSIPQTLILSLLPHATAVHKLLREAGILNDATIGAELSHIIASALHIACRGNGTETEFSTVIGCYTQAYHAYIMACKRLEEVEGMKWEHIISMTRSDYALEKQSRLRQPAQRYLLGYERLGKNAHFRCMITCAKLGVTFRDAGRLDEGVKHLTIAIMMSEKFFGPHHPDLLDLYEELTILHRRSGAYEPAYEAAIKRAKTYMFWTEVDHDAPDGSRQSSTIETSAGLVLTEEGTRIADQLGAICLRIPGREREAIKWFEVQLQGKENLYGENNPRCAGAMQKLAHAYNGQGNINACIYWWTKAVEAALEDMEPNMYYVEGDEEWEKPFGDDTDIATIIGSFREVTSDCSTLPSDLESFVWQMNCRAELWEKGRDTRELRREEIARQQEEEDVEFEKQVSEFQEKHPETWNVSYPEMMDLFICYRDYPGAKQLSIKQLGEVCAKQRRLQPGRK